MAKERCENQAKHCGGCPLLGQSYESQLTQKQAKLQALLGSYAPVEPIIPSPQPLHYRNKATATFATDSKGKLTCGLYAGGSHKVLPCTDCLLQAQPINEAIAAVLAAAKQCRWTPYDEDKGTGLVRHAQLRWGSKTGQLLVTLVTPTLVLPGSRNFAVALRKLLPGVTTIVQNINPTETSAVLGTQEKTLFGSGYILDELCGLKFAISSRSFYQVNPAQTETLYRKALEYAAPDAGGTLLDAYCGVGTIGLCAAGQAGRVIGVERNRDAVRDAVANARRNHIENAAFHCADATDWMRANAENLHPQAVILDPPRAGSTPECIAAVCGMKPQRVVYVSCGPEALARDLALFGKAGYRTVKIQPVDMFPQTEHVETVVLMSKTEGVKRRD